VVDELLVGTDITLGSGEPGVAIAVGADELILAYSATVADVAD
jgi:hypothetical protein